MTALRIEAEYPAKPVLSHSEALSVLRNGPVPAWFRPFAEHARVAPKTPRPWGYIHIHGEWGEPPAWELVGFHSLDGLAWGMQTLFTRGHTWHRLDLDGVLNDHECHGVFYWLPTDPRLLNLPLGITR